MRSEGNVVHCVVGCTAYELFARSIGILYAHGCDGDFCLQLNVCAVRPMIRLNVENVIWIVSQMVRTINWMSNPRDAELWLNSLFQNANRCVWVAWSRMIEGAQEYGLEPWSCNGWRSLFAYLMPLATASVFYVTWHSRPKPKPTNYLNFIKCFVSNAIVLYDLRYVLGRTLPFLNWNRLDNWSRQVTENHLCRFVETMTRIFFLE